MSRLDLAAQVGQGAGAGGDGRLGLGPPVRGRVQGGGGGRDPLPPRLQRGPGRRHRPARLLQAVVVLGGLGAQVLRHLFQPLALAPEAGHRLAALALLAQQLAQAAVLAVQAGTDRFVLLVGGTGPLLLGPQAVLHSRGLGLGPPQARSGLVEAGGGLDKLAPRLLPLSGGALHRLVPGLALLPRRDEVRVENVDLLLALREAPARLLQGPLGLGEGEALRLQLRFEAGEPRQPRLHRPRQLVELPLQGLQPLLKGVELVPPVAHVEVVELGLELLVASGPAHLPAEEVDVALDLADDVLDALQVRPRRLELVPGRPPAGLVLGDPRRLLEDAAAVLGPVVDDLVDHPLLHDRVGPRTQAGVHQQVLDVEEPAGDLVQQIVALARAEEAAGDRHLRVVDRQPLLGVVDGQRYLAHPQGLAAPGAGEDHVLHAVAADGAGALLAEDPPDRLDDVGLAAAVGTHDPRDPGAEGDLGLVEEGLEAEDVEMGQAQGRNLLAGGAAGGPGAEGGRGGEPLPAGEQDRNDTIMWVPWQGRGRACRTARSRGPNRRGARRPGPWR